MCYNLNYYQVLPLSHLWVISVILRAHYYHLLSFWLTSYKSDLGAHWSTLDLGPHRTYFGALWLHHVSGCHPAYRQRTFLFSVCKSSLKTGKRPEKNRTQTAQDRKFKDRKRPRPRSQSSVHQNLRKFKTNKNRFQPVSTSLLQQTLVGCILLKSLICKWY